MLEDLRESVFVDVDGTLLIWSEPAPGTVDIGGKPKINWKLIHRLRDWKRDTGGEIVIWSGNGKQHAQWAVEVAEIGDIVDAVHAKPRAMIDDSFEWFFRRRLYRPDGALVSG